MNPGVGSIGVAPKYDRRASFYQGSEWCGNIDICDVKPGAQVVLPVNVEGGLLLMGDVHWSAGAGLRPGLHWFREKKQDISDALRLTAMSLLAPSDCRTVRI